MTGIAIGPHLHVEVRLGASTYANNVNPYLWMKPAVGRGVVAVRLLTGDGRTWAGAKISIARFEKAAKPSGRQIETYLDTENIGPDPAWGENGAMGDARRLLLPDRQRERRKRSRRIRGQGRRDHLYRSPHPAIIS